MRVLNFFVFRSDWFYDFLNETDQPSTIPYFPFSLFLIYFVWFFLSFFLSLFIFIYLFFYFLFTFFKPYHSIFRSFHSIIFMLNFYQCLMRFFLSVKRLFLNVLWVEDISRWFKTTPNLHNHTTLGDYFFINLNRTRIRIRIRILNNFKTLSNIILICYLK